MSDLRHSELTDWVLSNRHNNNTDAVKLVVVVSKKLFLSKGYFLFIQFPVVVYFILIGTYGIDHKLNVRQIERKRAFERNWVLAKRQAKNDQIDYKNIFLAHRNADYFCN